MKRINMKKGILLLINLVNLVVVLLGFNNPESKVVHAESIGQDFDVGVLEIVQGASIHRIIKDSEELSFKLEVKDPQVGILYFWHILEPAMNGKATVSPEGQSAIASYNPDPGFLGEDSFLVEVTTSMGDNASVNVMVMVTPRENHPEMEILHQSDFRTGPLSQSVSDTEPDIPQQSTTGPTPPSEVIERDNEKPPELTEATRSEVVLSVPNYIWRHGCGPTALGMVIGYYDSIGFDDLVPGDASSQTSAIDQMIASGGDSGSPNPPGSEEHYEDYASPEDSSPTLIDDDYITAARTPHSDNCLADYMDTSKSTRDNYYGWSWSSDVGPAFLDFVNQQNSSYLTSYQSYYSSSGTLTESILLNEIDAGRPMVFLVDSDGNGSTDHFVPVIGYRYNPNLQYAVWDTWYAPVRWEAFAPMASDTPWGIAVGWSFGLQENQADPYFHVYPDFDEIEGFDWLPNTSVTLTIESQNWDELSDENGRVYFDITQFDIIAGQTAVMTDGVSTRTHSINISITEINGDTNTVSGKAEAGGDVHVACEYDGNLDELTVTADPSGNWMAEFTEVNMVPGAKVSAVQIDEEGNATFIDRFIPDPFMRIRPLTDYVNGIGWLPNTPITLTIGTEEWNKQSNVYGDVDFFTSSFDITEGQVVEMTDGTNARTHIVTSLMITDIDEVTDTISGTAAAGSEVEIHGYGINGENLIVTADSSGDWTAVFTIYDLEPGANGNAYQYDLEGNSTCIYWDIPDPYIMVYPMENQIYGDDWLPNVPITLTIETQEWVEESNINGWVSFINLPIDIISGQVVEMADGTNTRSSTVTSLTITDIDEAEDTIYGTAEAGSEISVNAYNDYDWENQTVIADSSGDWTAVFTNIDIASGTNGYACQYDEEGNSTYISWRIPDPYIQVYPVGDQIYGGDWTPNVPITLNIGTQEWVEESDEYGWVNFSNYSIDIFSGQIVEMADGIYTRTHTVTSLAVTDIDEAADTIRGTAEAYSEISVYGDDGIEGESMTVTADSSGNWSAVFTNLDLVPGTYGYAHQYDLEGNSTSVYWFVPDPEIAVWPLWDQIYGGKWTPNTPITLTIGTQEWTEVSSRHGFVRFINLTMDILPGMAVEMTDGIYTRTHTVTDLTVTGVDEFVDTVSGTADADSEVYVSGYDDYSMEEMTVSADISGNWMASFTQLDLATGIYGNALQYDGEGNSTRIRWYVPDPSISVYVESDQISSSNWMPGMPITLTIGTQEWFEESDDNGWVYFSTSPFVVVAGQVVEISDGTYTRSHAVSSLTIADIDEVADAISGTAEAASEVYVYGLAGYGWEEMTVSADPSGSWNAAFTYFDIAPGAHGEAVQFDEEGHSTRINWEISNPTLAVFPEEDYIGAWDFEPNTTITLTIGTFTDSQVSNSTGSVDFYVEPFDIQGGQLVELNDGIHYEDHLVRDFTIDMIDVGADTISGTADPGSELEGEISVDGDSVWTSPNPIADGAGSWTADFSGLADIVQGSYGWIHQGDEDGDQTQVSWSVPNPLFDVYPDTDYVRGENWLADTEIILTFESATYTTTSDSAGNFEFNGLTIDLQAGDTVEVSDGASYKSHTILPLTLVSVDEETDTVTGTATPESEVWSGVCDSDDCYGMWVTADINGDFSADMSTIGIDITSGSRGIIGQPDEDEDGTCIGWDIPNPTLAVFPEEEYIGAWDFEPNTTISLTIGTFTDSQVSDGTGSVDFYVEPFDIQPGQLVEMDDGIHYEDHLVRNFTIDVINADADTISGTAEPGSELAGEMWTEGGTVWTSPNPIADGSGNWTADFSGLADIVPGSYGWIHQWDEDGDQTQVSWGVPNPAFDVNPDGDNVWGWDWLADTEITLTFDSETYTTTSDSEGDFEFNELAVDLQAGDTVEVSDGVSSKTHTILPLTLISVDRETDTVTGTTTSGSEVWSHVCNDDNCAGILVTADTNGDFSADMSTVGVDIRTGTFGNVCVGDEDGDDTCIGWNIPNPQLVVFPEDDYIGAWDFEPNTTITLTIGTFTDAQVSDDTGSVDFYVGPFDVQGGQLVELDDGIHYEDHLVRDITIDVIDADADTISGTAEAGSELAGEMWTESGSVWTSPNPIADGSGNWTADFSGVADIVPGSYGWIHQWDEDGDQTQISWGVPNPLFDVYPDTDFVRGENWLADTEITLTFDSETYTTTSDSEGDFEFNELAVDLQAGDTVEVSDGVSSKTHTILPLTLISVDRETDTVTGTATPDSEVWSEGCDSDHCEGIWVTADTNGDFSADMNTIGIDIATGSQGYIRQADEDEDGTCIGWEIPNTLILAFPETDGIEVRNFLPNTPIELTITGGGGYTDTALSDSEGRVVFDLAPFDLQPGHLIEAFDGESLDSHVVIGFTIENVNPGMDTVSGRAEPGSELAGEMWVEGGSVWATPNPIADGSGNWTADFSGVGDIVPGSTGIIHQWDEDGDATQVFWRVPKPIFEVNISANQIRGYDWTPNKNIDLTIDGLYYGSIVSDNSGDVWFEDLTFELIPGMVVEMTDGISIRTHTIIDIAITEIDQANDQVSGTANPGELETYACDNNDTCGWRYPVADIAGEWTAEYSPDVDITPGSGGGARQYDVQGNATYVYWEIPFPQIRVNPDADLIRGYDWQPGATVTIDIDTGTYSESLVADEEGYVEFMLQAVFDVLPAQVVAISDGVSSKTHEVRPLAVTDYDEVADTLTGTADPGELYVRTCDISQCFAEYLEADGTGVWNTDMSGKVDIAAGTIVYIWQSDEDLDDTFITWILPDPHITAEPDTDTIQGSGWPQNTEVTLTINGDRETWVELSNEYGEVSFTLEGFDLLPTSIVEMAADTYTESHTVKEIIVLEIDPVADIIYGTAEGSSEFEICAYPNPIQTFNGDCFMVTADGDGNWEADFSGLVDIKGGSWGKITQNDEFSNRTIIDWEVENVAPEITGQVELSTPEETALLINVLDLNINDPDNTYPDDFHLTVMEGSNYTHTGITITPESGFTGTLTVPVKVSDGLADSNRFDLSITVTEDEEGYHIYLPLVLY